MIHIQHYYFINKIPYTSSYIISNIMVGMYMYCTTITENCLVGRRERGGVSVCSVKVCVVIFAWQLYRLYSNT